MAVADLIEDALSACDDDVGRPVKVETAILMAYLRGQKSMLHPPPMPEEHDTPVKNLWRRDEITRPASVRSRKKLPPPPPPKKKP